MTKRAIIDADRSDGGGVTIDMTPLSGIRMPTSWKWTISDAEAEALRDDLIAALETRDV